MKSPFLATLLCTLMIATTLTVFSAEVKNPVEIGDVRWGRDLPTALAQSASSGKPVLVLFQEVPGCAGCQKFGRDVLTHPLLVEAIEDEFVPVVIYNNRNQGQDLAVRLQYQEPAWNYQVMRFLKADGQDLIPRQDRVWTTAGVAARMIEALEAAQRPAPNYLRVVSREQDTAKHKSAAFAMFCFWTGEYELGKIDGVISTEAGWLEGREVTLVHYHQDRLSLSDLAQKAAEVKCARKVFASTEAERSALSRVSRLNVGRLDERYRKAKASDQKKQIQRWNLAGVPGLTPMQLTKLNAFGPDNRNRALEWLSPRQRQGLDNQ